MKTNRLLRRLAQLAIWLIAGVFVLAIVGAAYQVIATRLDQRHFPPPGQLVDIGGHRLHIHCTGEGSPTVVLDAAADMMSADWGWIQPEIARRTRVCSYDRSGMGWSDHGPPPSDAKQASFELHTLLAKANISGPYVMVGHSVGGLYVRTYTARYADEVMGIVMVDPGHPDMHSRIPALRVRNASDARMVRTAGFLAYFGLPRLLGIGKSNAQGLPPQQVAEVNAFVSRPQHWTTLLALIEATDTTYDEVRATGSLGNRPLVVISADTAWFNPGAPADDTRRSLNDLQRELAGLSRNSSLRVVAGATHGSLVHNKEDAQAVIAAIEQVLTSLQTGRPLTQ